jgi:hypothetical protein
MRRKTDKKRKSGKQPDFQSALRAFSNIFARPKPTGIGFALTSVNPLHFPLKLPLPEASTTLSATAS